MKFLFLSVGVFFTLLLSACQTGDQVPAPAQLRGKWQLIQYYSIWTDKYYSAQELPYTEFYYFEQDSTFRKFRSTGVETGGRYSIKLIGEEYYINLTYALETNPDKQALQWSCTSQQPELQLILGKSLVQDDSPCDGPRNYYQKVDENE